MQATVSLTLGNTIIANNTGHDCQTTGTLIDQGYNLIERTADQACNLVNGVNNNIIGSDPLLAPLADNGGGTPTHALDINSPALNKIPNGVNGCGTTIITDQRGVVRPTDTSCDIGAFEGSIALPNNTPSFTSTPLTAATENITYTYAISSTDPDMGDVLTVTGTTIPSWLTLIPTGSGTANLNGVPSNSDVGGHSVSLLVTDSGGLTDTQSFNIAVSPAPAPSYVITLTGLLKGQITSSYVVTNTGISDANIIHQFYNDANMVIHSELGTIQAGAAQAVMLANISELPNGYSGYVVIAADQPIVGQTLTPPPVNNTPNFTSSPTTSVDQGQLYTYNIGATDPDSDPLTINATTKPTWLTLVDNGNGTAILSGTPSSNDVGTHAVTLLVADNGGLTSAQSFIITVNAAQTACTENDLKNLLL